MNPRVLSAPAIVAAFVLLGMGAMGCAGALVRLDAAPTHVSARTDAPLELVYAPERVDYVATNALGVVDVMSPESRVAVADALNARLRGGMTSQPVTGEKRPDVECAVKVKITLEEELLLTFVTARSMSVSFETTLPDGRKVQSEPLSSPLDVGIWRTLDLTLTAGSTAVFSAALAVALVVALGGASGLVPPVVQLGIAIGAVALLVPGLGAGGAGMLVGWHVADLESALASELFAQAASAHADDVATQFYGGEAGP